MGSVGCAQWGTDMRSGGSIPPWMEEGGLKSLYAWRIETRDLVEMYLKFLQKRMKLKFVGLLAAVVGNVAFLEELLRCWRRCQR
jgi:hypothetical protein